MTLFKKFLITNTLLLVCLLSSVTFAKEGSTEVPQSGFFLPSELKWSKGPNSLPKGVEIAVLEGNPSESGPFTIRLKFPADYKIPPHYHPIIEHVTVLSGNFYLGMGDNFDTKKAKSFPPGSFLYMEAKMHHYAFNRTKTVIQLHGIGPWGITYINPQDDPRNKR